MPKYNRKAFFDAFKQALDPTLSQLQVNGLEFLLGHFEADKIWTDKRYVAYALATIYHETAGSMQPVEEGYYLGSAAKVKAFQKTLRYYPFFGRGYVQLTWRKNYDKAGRAIGADLVNTPALALDPENAFQILTLGMFQGWFTGKKLADYINVDKTDYVNARKVINGLDRAGLIAGYARKFEALLKNSAAGSDDSLQEQGGDDSSNSTSNNPAVTDPPSIPPAAVVTVQKEQPSIWAKIIAIFTTVAGIGINLGTLVQQKLEALTPIQIGYLIAVLGLAALGIWIYQKAAKGAQMRTLALIDKAADPTQHTVELTK